MSSHLGTYTLGPDSATLIVKTGKTGPAALAGHNLQIAVTSWSATLELTEDPTLSTLSLTADSRSLRTKSGSGGAQALGAEDLPNIDKTMDSDVLKGGQISFRSTHVHPGDGDNELHVHGDLDLLGKSGPIEFTLSIAPTGELSAATTVVQTAFGIKPYSILFGTMKVADAVEVLVEGTLPAAS